MKNSENYKEDLVSSIEEYLKNIYPLQYSLIDNTSFIQSLNYTLLAGGKRIRPMLCLLFAELSAQYTSKTYNQDDIMPCAAALEMIHTYSLIHDDLPAMDNDDLRRGKPTCHKAFDEATAILTGDALLTDAFTVFTKANFPAENVLMGLRLLSMCAGSKGMIAGQVLDMAMEKNSTQAIQKDNLENLIQMNARKTGDLLLASCCISPLIYNTDTKFYDECKAFGTHFGLAFQITDDILDVVGDTKEMGKPQGSDQLADKTTWVTLLGLEKAREEAIKNIEKTKEILLTWQSFTNHDSQAINLLLQLTQSLAKRTK